MCSPQPTLTLPERPSQLADLEGAAFASLETITPPATAVGPAVSLEGAAGMDSFGARGTMNVGGARFSLFRLSTLARTRPAVERLPFCLKILLENLLRHEDGRAVRAEDVEALCAWDPAEPPHRELAFHPARVLLQDFTGVPAVVDLAAMREAFAALGGDPKKIDPLLPADLVIDHSVQVDHAGTSVAFQQNAARDYERNGERYAFLRWGQQAFRSLLVVPPATGICHQVNLEFLASTVFRGPGGLVYPDTLVGTDSHTTMVNGLGVLGWGVGGIEAEAALLGQPLSMLLPQVVGLRLTGKLAEGGTATDVVLTVTELLRKHGVVGKLVEFTGPGLETLTLADRATIANMSPEYGATAAFFPVDDETLAYLRFTNRSAEQVALVEAYCKDQGLFRTASAEEPRFSELLALDLGTVQPTVAGPRRPQDRVPLHEVKAGFRKGLPQLPAEVSLREVPVSTGGVSFGLAHGAVVIAALTSCTNTSNPAVMLGAGLLAKKAVERGLRVPPWVKCSLAPGSKVVTGYLREAGLLPYLEGLGFHLVGYGCTTCIGNSGPLPPPIAEAVERGELSVAAVLSGNRNFEARIHPQVRQNFLASPPLVVAYALAGSLDVDLTRDPLGHDPSGEPVHLSDLWPTNAEIKAAISASVRPEQFRKVYAEVFEGDERWRALKIPGGQSFAWDPRSSYVRRPPFFEGLTREPAPLLDVDGARVLALLGDSVTTDHISPAGSIARDSPAARYLEEQGVPEDQLNSYGSRRGNHEVMVRGTFANVRLRNGLVPGVEGGRTVHLPSRAKLTIYEAAVRYRAEKVPLVILAGAEYGTGSSRDWAAKGTALLGVRAVIARSFERIHRSNLVGMGVLPLELEHGASAASLGLTGTERFDLTGLAAGVAPRARLAVRVTPDGGQPRSFPVTARIDTPNEADYYRHGGILPFVLRQLLRT